MSDVSVLGYWIPYLSSRIVQGYPPPRDFIPALETVGLNVDYVNLEELRKQGSKNEIEEGLKKAKSNKIILSYWNHHFRADLDSLYSDKSKKFITMINWNEETKGKEEKLKILSSSSYVTFSQKYFRDQWIRELGEEGEAFRNKMVIWRFPCTRGAILDKGACRRRLGIKTPYSVIVWGYYGIGKGHKFLLDTILTLFDTTLIVCGTPASPPEKNYLFMRAVKLGMQERVLFSRPLISEEESNVWFSAADIGVVSYFQKMGESSLAYLLGHQKAVLTSDLECFREYEKKGLVIRANKNNFGKTLSDLIVNEKRKEDLETNVKIYLQGNNWNSTGILFKKLLEDMK